MKKPDEAVLSAAIPIDARAAELEADGHTPRRALVIALLEVSPDVLREIDEQDEAATWNRRASNDAVAVQAATANMGALLKEASVHRNARIIRRRDWDDCGRDAVLIGFQVVRGDRRAPVLMPGVPAARWIHERCYIDGNSWMWKYAPKILREALGLLWNR